jgi:IS30 family transposase
MRIRKRRPFSSSETRDMWARWRSGESVTQIANGLGRFIPNVWLKLLAAGGIAPRERSRHPQHLTESEREEISRGLARQMGVREIARALGRHPSTISREVRRNGGTSSYRSTCAEQRARDQAKRPKLCKLARSPLLQRAVAKQLSQYWSPEQIAGWLRSEYPNDPSMQISHETIYRSLFVQARGVLKAELRDHLRSQQRMRRTQASRANPQARSHIPDAVSIRERPAEVQDRAVPGHWEGDLLMGTPSSCIVTLVERTTRFVMLAKVDSKATEDVVPALTKCIRKLPAELRRSVTWDRGTELAAHKDFTVATDVDVYFCDPASPWQRGTNENTNGLLRHYYPNGVDVSRYSQAELNAVAKQLNQRPRKTLGFVSPAEALNQLLQ